MSHWGANELLNVNHITKCKTTPTSSELSGTIIVQGMYRVAKKHLKLEKQNLVQFFFAKV